MTATETIVGQITIAGVIILVMGPVECAIAMAIIVPRTRHVAMTAPAQWLKDATPFRVFGQIWTLEVTAAADAIPVASSVSMYLLLPFRAITR